jgi:MFS family permease
LGVDAEMAKMTVGQRLLHMPLLLLLYSLLLGIALVPAQSSLMTMMQLAVPDLKRGRVGSAMNAITTTASLLSMATAAALGEVVALRLIYVTAGLFVSAGGLVGLLVLQEPAAPVPEAALDEVS